MFRKMRRFKQQVSEEEVIRVLKEGKRAAFSMHGEDGYPYTIPINYVYNEENNRIYFHGAKEGHKMDALQKDNRVCFTVWDEGYQTPDSWEYNVTSVIAFGKIHFVQEQDVHIAMLRKLAEKYYPSQEEVEHEMQSSGVGRAQLFEIEIEHITGKLVNEK